MSINKQTGNMYPFVSCTWNPIRGACPHQCSYCYMKDYPQGILRLDEKCFDDDLSKESFVFIGSSTDMFCKEVPIAWIMQVIAATENYLLPKYLFQSKNAEKLWKFSDAIRKCDMMACTIESNREHQVSKAPDVIDRVVWFSKDFTCQKMISIEPIMDFDIDDFLEMIKQIAPAQISIGADSKGHKLKEPPKAKLLDFLAEIEKKYKVIRKPNLRRLLW